MELKEPENELAGEISVTFWSREGNVVRVSGEFDWKVGQYPTEVGLS